MRGMVLIATIAGVVLVLAGMVASTRDGHDQVPVTQRADTRATSTVAGTVTNVDEVRPTGVMSPTPTSIPAQVAVAPTVTVEPELLSQLPAVAQPALQAPTRGDVASYYAETHHYDQYTIAWQPGAFPAELAVDVAAQARVSHDTVNRLLGTADREPITIYLADQLFDESCIGCQGFAAADLRQVFILADGSVSPAELPSLLTHEIGHLVAGTAIALPESLFFAESLAVWVSTSDIEAQGFVSPRQTAVWALEAGVLPTLAELLDASYAGRVRARVEYDAAGSFAFFVIERYGIEVYTRMYQQSRYNPSLAPDVVGLDWATLEMEWHAYLGPWAGDPGIGDCGTTWWQVAEQVSEGFQALYANPAEVSVEQYALLTQARLELNRFQCGQAVTLATASGLTTGTAN